MSLRDRIRREREAAAKKYEAEQVRAKAAREASDQQAARKQEEYNRAYTLYQESPCPELLEMVNDRKNGRYFHYDLSRAPYEVELRWEGWKRQMMGQDRKVYFRVTAGMQADGTLYVQGKRRKTFALAQWRRNPNAVDAAFEDAYLNPEQSETRYWVSRDEGENFYY